MRCGRWGGGSLNWDWRAMAQTTVAITGSKELDKALAQFTPRVQLKIERRGVRQAAKPVADRARDYAPADEGDLEESIRVRPLRRSRKNAGRIGARIVTSESDNLFQGQQFYGAFQEFGTAYVQPVGYMRRARDEMKNTVARIFHDVVKEAVRTTANEVRPRVVQSKGVSE
jgi:HK97 gp10 family phage protein